MTQRAGLQPLSQAAQRERVELILGQLDELPTLPAVAARLLAVTSSDESSARDVVEIIESDTALTAAILKLVRRADLGVRGKAMTVPRAVTLLGFNAVRNAVLSVQLFDAFSTPDQNRRATATRKGIWLHSLAAACAAEAIGELISGPGLGGEAFVCGLLHDIGKIALDACLPKSYARVTERVERQYTCICDVEREIIGLDHTAAGKRLVERWQLPQAIGECTWLHHQSPDALPSSVVFNQLVRIVHLADNLVRREGIGFSGYGYVDDVDELAGELGESAEALAGVLQRLPERMEPFQELVGLDDGHGRSEYTASLVTANRQLAQINAKLAAVNRRLEVRSACLAALENFTKRLSKRDQISDICVAAAESICTLLGAERALALFGEASSRCIYVGCSQAGDQRGVDSIIDLGESPDTAEVELIRSIPPVRGFIAAPDGCRIIWQRCTGRYPGDPLWILPLMGGQAAVGGVLIAAPERTLARFLSAPTECEALSSAMWPALMSAKARNESERTNEELLDLNRRLTAARKGLVRTRSISMIAAMAAGAAHELNNPLAVISGRAQMELERCSDEESARTLEVIIEQTRQAAQIVTDLMDFAKPEPPRPVTCSLPGLLEPLCQHWRAGSSLREDQLSLSLADRETAVYADPQQLRQALDAVVSNALQATKRETARLNINSPSRASDETVRIVVEDNGVGMTREALEHAIDPFFSARPAGRGRGLGLSRTHRLLEINGGRLRLESTPKVGTKVTIELPARPPTS